MTPSTPATRAVIAAIYAQIEAPNWARANLDGLADVLGDLSWLPPGPVTVRLPELTGLPAAQAEAVRRIVTGAAAASGDTDRPLRVG